MGFINISDTRNEIHHIIKGLKKDREYVIVDISEIRKNKKNPKYCNVTIKYEKRVKNNQARARPGIEMMQYELVY